MQNAEKPEDAAIVPKNIIVIMNKSLTDFEEFENLKASEEILPNIHNLQENTKKVTSICLLSGEERQIASTRFLPETPRNFCQMEESPIRCIVMKMNTGLPIP